MMPYFRTLLIAIGCASLAACASVDVADVRDMPSTGNDFQRALHKEYVTISQRERDEQHFTASGRWAGKGQRAANGESVAPEVLANWPLPAGTEGDLAAARARLMAAFDKGAADIVPGPLAHAQAMFDCWVEEQSENLQPRDIARCRAGFEDAMAQVDEALKPPPVAAPPPPPPPPPPEIQRNFLVFFDFDKSNLTAEARAILQSAAAAAGQGPVRQIHVTGHADRSGPDRYNQGLSERRAEAVRAELERLGVNVLIATDARGETEPLVPTNDGVREPQNRRASIYLE